MRRNSRLGDGRWATGPCPSHFDMGTINRSGTFLHGLHDCLGILRPAITSSMLLARSLWALAGSCGRISPHIGRRGSCPRHHSTGSGRGDPRQPRIYWIPAPSCFRDFGGWPAFGRHRGRSLDVQSRPIWKSIRVWNTIPAFGGESDEGAAIQHIIRTIQLLELFPAIPAMGTLFPFSPSGCGSARSSRRLLWV
jgi:hypothetical protein